MENQKILNLPNEASDSKFVARKMEHCQWSIESELWCRNLNYL